MSQLDTYPLCNACLHMNAPQVVHCARCGAPLVSMVRRPADGAKAVDSDCAALEVMQREGLLPNPQSLAMLSSLAAGAPPLSPRRPRTVPVKGGSRPSGSKAAVLDAGAAAPWRALPASLPAPSFAAAAAAPLTLPHPAPWRAGLQHALPKPSLGAEGSGRVLSQSLGGAQEDDDDEEEDEEGRVYRVHDPRKSLEDKWDVAALRHEFDAHYGLTFRDECVSAAQAAALDLPASCAEEAEEGDGTVSVWDRNRPFANRTCAGSAPVFLRRTLSSPAFAQSRNMFTAVQLAIRLHRALRRACTEVGVGKYVNRDVFWGHGLSGKGHTTPGQSHPYILERLRALTMLGPGDLFTDIGHGEGCAVIATAALTGCSAYGVELFPSRHDAAAAVLAGFLRRVRGNRVLAAALGEECALPAEEVTGGGG